MSTSEKSDERVITMKLCTHGIKDVRVRWDDYRAYTTVLTRMIDGHLIEVDEPEHIAFEWKHFDGEGYPLMCTLWSALKEYGELVSEVAEVIPEEFLTLREYIEHLRVSKIDGGVSTKSANTGDEK